MRPRLFVVEQAAENAASKGAGGTSHAGCYGIAGGGMVAGGTVVALRGSWATAHPADAGSRRPPKLIKVDRQGQVSDLLTGFQAADGGCWARPVGLLFAPDGSLLFTVDEGAEGLYRLSAAP